MRSVLLVLASISLSFLGCQKQKENALVLTETSPQKDKPRNIIFIVGDGMALAQVSASVIWERNQSWFEKFPVVGFHKPAASDNLITDSAAGATSFASGVKTKNSMIGLDANGQRVETIIEWAEKKGMATGILVTSSVTHATPAAFAAHADNRAFYDEIAAEMLKTPIDCVIGGGAATFKNNQNGYGLADSLKAKGYTVKESFNSPRTLPNFETAFYLFTAENEPGTYQSGRRYLPHLVNPTAQYLSKRSEKGYFMLIEGSQIDWALHANDRRYLRDEMHDFEQTLEEVLKYAALDGQTLVIVTGDHECGGLSLASKSRWGDVDAVFATRIHTGAMVPVFAYGPGSKAFNGIYENTAIHTKMKEVLAEH
jgi:alkaline phosphatase